MSTAILARWITWTDLRPELPQTVCAVCGDWPTVGEDAACERCGVPLCFAPCWLEGLATPEERARFRQGDTERLPIFCAGCRS